MLKLKFTLGLDIKPTNCETFFLGDTTGERRSITFSIFSKNLPLIKTRKKNKKLIIFGPQLCAKTQADSLAILGKSRNWEKLSIMRIMSFLSFTSAVGCRCCFTSQEPVHD